MSNLFNKIIDGKQFNFQPIDFGNQSGYHVNVKDDDGLRWEFRMFHDGERSLKMEGENLPGWLAGLEKELIQAVNAHE